MAGQNLFNSVKLSSPQKNVFDLSHDIKLSLNMAELVPIMCTETVPGDKFHIGCDSMIRFAPLVAPVMHIFNATIHYFFVPHRLLWENWESYITNTNDPGTNLPHAFPWIEVGNATQTRLSDYMGIPPTASVTQVERVSAVPFAAYQKIYNDYYRDQNLQADIKDDIALIDGDNNGSTTDLLTLRKRCWEHDYFTSALPFAQKGDSATIPIGEIVINPDLPNDPSYFVERVTHSQVNSSTIETSATAQTIADTGAGTVDVNYDPNGSLVVEPVTINSLRRAFKLQEFLEKMARGGSRYIEVIKSFFNVTSSDARLQRPEYITGTKTGVVISEVTQNSSTDLTSPQGNLSGHGIAVDSGKHGSYYCEEHGYIIGILSVLPKTAYMQGVPKHFTKIDDLSQYYWPPYANIGEQEIQLRELFSHTPAGASTFGYVPRYAEYKFENSRVAGDFRSSLDFWTEARKFAAAPSLNGAFVEADPDHRIFAVTDPTVQKLYAHVYNKIKAIRPMPKFGTPTF